MMKRDGFGLIGHRASGERDVGVLLSVSIPARVTWQEANGGTPGACGYDRGDSRAIE